MAPTALADNGTDRVKDHRRINRHGAAPDRPASPVDVKQNFDPARTLDHGLSRVVWSPPLDEADLCAVRIGRSVTGGGVARPPQQLVPRVVEDPQRASRRQFLNLRSPSRGRDGGKVVDEDGVA